ncbi:hypothetical protein K438DRAFT_618943 [Mycena galopus ATCC 62051]|nr:hypothetical protein K438DRAFT_618943 [Mycena galopus ATCC 62051]
MSARLYVLSNGSFRAGSNHMRFLLLKPTPASVRHCMGKLNRHTSCGSCSPGTLRFTWQYPGMYFVCLLTQFSKSASSSFEFCISARGLLHGCAPTNGNECVHLPLLIFRDRLMCFEQIPINNINVGSTIDPQETVDVAAASFLPFVLIPIILDLEERLQHVFHQRLYADIELHRHLLVHRSLEACGGGGRPTEGRQCSA